MNENGSKSKVIIGIQQMSEYMEVSDKKLRDLISAGMPHGVICGKYYFHLGNVDIWFRKMTSRQVNIDPNDIVEMPD